MHNTRCINCGKITEVGYNGLCEECADKMRSERRSSIDPKARTIYEQAVEKWGDKAQIIQSLEELSELSKALCKLFRGGS